jgi:hypothetical protein
VSPSAAKADKVKVFLAMRFTAPWVRYRLKETFWECSPAVGLSTLPLDSQDIGTSHWQFEDEFDFGALAWQLKLRLTSSDQYNAPH